LPSPPPRARPQLLHHLPAFIDKLSAELINGVVLTQVRRGPSFDDGGPWGGGSGWVPYCLKAARERGREARHCYPTAAPPAAAQVQTGFHEHQRSAARGDGQGVPAPRPAPRAPGMHGVVLKQLARCLGDAEPAIRVNTVICLARVSPQARVRAPCPAVPPIVDLTHPCARAGDGREGARGDAAAGVPCGRSGTPSPRARLRCALAFTLPLEADHFWSPVLLARKVRRRSSGFA